MAFICDKHYQVQNQKVLADYLIEQLDKSQPAAWREVFATCTDHLAETIAEAVVKYGAMPGQVRVNLAVTLLEGGDPT